MQGRTVRSAREDPPLRSCAGSISEIADAEAPFHPRGCVAQAWSVAEVLRASSAGVCEPQHSFNIT
jgi:glycogen debranching enzyme